jgi:transcriptional regulator with XRE-family HTH domain
VKGLQNERAANDQNASGRLQAIREWHGQDRAAVAAHLQLDEAALAQIESARLPVDVDMAGRIALLFDVPADWIAG